MELVATLNAPEHRVPLQRQLVTAIQDGLGPEVDVDPFVVRKADSIELLILLSTAAKVISDYNPIVEGIQTAVARTRAIVRDFVADFQRAGGVEDRHR